MGHGKHGVYFTGKRRCFFNHSVKEGFSLRITEEPGFSLSQGRGEGTARGAAGAEAQREAGGGAGAGSRGRAGLGWVCCPEVGPGSQVGRHGCSLGI